MAITNYTKNKTGDFDLDQLHNTVNIDKNINPSCISVSSEEVSENSHDITFEFTNALNTPEEDRLEQLVNEHSPVSPSVPLRILPFSDIDDKKLAVHPSYKPTVDGGSTYAVWTGAGDDLSQSPSGLGEGPMLHWDMSPQTGSPLVTQEVTVDLEFDPAHGRVWVHEGYLKFNNGGCGDYMESYIMSYATPVQTAANKILYIEDNWIKYATGSPSPATHGWAGTPVLVPRTFSQDGDWDWDGTNLTPNLNGTGGYKISDIQRKVHRYFNKIPCSGSSPYFSMTSDETTEILEGYFIRISAYNISNTTWNASIIIEIYRERTYVP